MSETVLMTLIVTLFRGAMILVGFGFAVLGYNLFVKGVYERAGDLRAAWGDRNLVLKQAAPGTFFALFGVIVIAISIVRGAGIEAPTFSPPFNRRVVTGIEYPTVSQLLEANKLNIQGSWDRWHFEMAVLHNIRLFFIQAGIPPKEYSTVFNESLVPILKQEPTEKRGATLVRAKAYLLESLSPASPNADLSTLLGSPIGGKSGLGVD